MAFSSIMSSGNDVAFEGFYSDLHCQILLHSSPPSSSLSSRPMPTVVPETLEPSLQLAAAVLSQGSKPLFGSFRFPLTPELEGCDMDLTCSSAAVSS
ncbi:hypothetical protein D0Y65_027948 [Glycine soja]|uniref:Uncharacterized protein n=1 Tax=Glycine soja TaxID=3848 RepID=A0A445IRX4_GLYSO|nr:hypothetical protein D0Y65_027948 [Glycine soja]